MNLSKAEAKDILRLPTEGKLERSSLDEAFHKMIRRYPIEQFPDKFSQIRQAYEILKDPCESVRSILFSDTFDLSSLIESYEPLNAKTDSETETFVFESLAALLKCHLEEILFDDSSDPGLADSLSMLEQNPEEMSRFLDELIEMSLGRSDRKKPR